MVDRDFHDPESMVGISADELLAMTPDGWIHRPFPDGRPGFKLLDPIAPGGYFGTATFYGGGTPGFRTFGTPQPLPVAVLNESLELPTLGELARPIADEDLTQIPHLISTARALLASGLVRVWRDDLNGTSAVVLRRREALSALDDRSNWVPPEMPDALRLATPVLLLDATARGRRALRRYPRRPLSLRRPPSVRA